MNSFSGLFKAEERSNLQSTNTQSDSCTIEMERFLHLTSKIVSPDSRISRNLARKGLNRDNEKKINSNADTETDASNFPISSSPKAAQLVDSSTPVEKPIVVTVGAMNHQLNQQFHHQITITTPTTTTTTATMESKLGGRIRNSVKRSSSWTIDPRKILLFFATLSSMGTILLIYLTLSTNNVGGDANTTGQ